MAGSGKAETPKYATARTDAQRLEELRGYADAHLPRFGMMPWTAPVYDESNVAGQPELYCMSSLPTAEEPDEPSCTCLTEQGTKYDLSQPECRTVARFGAPYNPYRQPREAPAVSSPPPQEQGSPAPARSVLGVVVEKAQNNAQSFPEIEQVPSTL